MQTIPNKFSFLVVDSEEAEKLIKLGHLLMEENVRYQSEEVQRTVPLLLNFLHEHTKPAPWRFSFDFSVDALRELQVSNDPRFETVTDLVERASLPPITLH
ncbi:hypothetical protein A8O37_30850 [Pseudomonas aeruginosa]|nr:hypothetical protein A8O37_30850 [Pseudomonas aeruginosa]